MAEQTDKYLEWLELEIAKCEAWYQKLLREAPYDLPYHEYWLTRSEALEDAKREYEARLLAITISE